MVFGISQNIRPILAVLAIFVGAACTHADNQTPSTCAASQWTKTELYLGRGSPDGEVPQSALQIFLDKHVTPNFPDGYTVLDAQGAWRSDDRETTETEASMVLVILHPGRADDYIKIDTIAAAYISEFKQESVLESEAPICVTFH